MVQPSSNRLLVESQIGAANGIAALDSGGRVPEAQTYATVLNAKAYGVIGNGVADDTAAIQALFTAAGPNTTIYFPAGTYKHTNLVITGKSNFALIGFGAVFVATTRTQRYISFVNCTDFTVRGITSKGAIATVRSGPTRGISIEGCSRFVITENHVHDTEGVGIYAGAATGVSPGSFEGSITNNLVHDTWADGIHITGASKHIVVANNRIRNSGDDSIAVVSYGTDTLGPCENIAVTGNTIYRAESRGLALVGGKTVAMTGNTIQETKNAGIYIAQEASYGTRAIENVTISGNTIVAANTYDSPSLNYAGIQVVGDGGTATPVTGVTITGNTIDGSRWHGIMVGSAGVGCYNIIISDNDVKNSGSHAMLLQAAQDVVISDNLINTAGEGGIYCNDTRGLLSIVGNVIREPNRTSVAGSKRGIFVGTPSLVRGQVVGNMVYDSTGYTNQPLDLSTGVNLMVYGNAVGGNMTNYPVSGLPFIAPGNILLAGSFATSGLGGGVGVIGVRNAATVPASNPSSGGILYAESGAARWRTAAGTVSTVGGDVTAVSANYTALVSDRTILATGGAAGITVTLPAAVKGARFEIAKVDADAGAVTVATTSAQTINGAATKVLAAQYEKVTVVSNGTAWFIV